MSSTIYSGMCFTRQQSTNQGSPTVTATIASATNNYLNTFFLPNLYTLIVNIFVYTLLINIYTRTNSTTAAYDIYRYWRYMIGEAAHAKTRLHYTHVVYIQNLTHIHPSRWNCTFTTLCSEHASTFKQHKWHAHVILLLKLNIINLCSNHVCSYMMNKQDNKCTLPKLFSDSKKRVHD